tara:strand:- start:5603 stop:6448 length:846 start_codon:yes stop_codon:yes gene_type:complete
MVHITAEIGINHNSDVGLAKQMITAAQRAGANAVKFQKKDPRRSTPEDQWDKPKHTPWGTTERYIDYKIEMEFGQEECDELWEHARSLGIDLFWSVWDIPSLDFILRYDAPFIKIPSSKLTDEMLLFEAGASSRSLILSTGMSTLEEVEIAVSISNPEVVMHSVSTYPCPVDELNLNALRTLQEAFPHLALGYSGHETGLATTVAAVAMGATFVERHFTLDRSLPGTDQSASVEPEGFRRMVKDIRNVELALGDGVKRVMPSEEEAIIRLRGRSDLPISSR